MSWRNANGWRRLKWAIGILIMGLILLGGIGYVWLNEAKPELQSGPEADEKARAMLLALNEAGWQQTDQIEWTFVGARSYVWNKAENTVLVKWRSNEVWVDLDAQRGEVHAPLDRAGDEALIRKAINLFNNDSFWLAAPYKVFDPGTERGLVTLPDGREGLMVTYTQGGTTPGDSYVWILDDQNRPMALKLWVSIIPIGGLEARWEDYKRLETGAMVAQSHRFGGWVNLPVTDLSVATNVLR